MSNSLPKAPADSRIPPDVNAPPPPAAPPRRLGMAVAKGAAWTVSFRMAQRLIGVVSTLLLARLLVPSDFGLIAMAMTLLALIEVVTVGEFSSAIIQNPNATRDHYNTAWTLSVLFGLTAALLLILFAQPAAIFFREPRLANVIYWLSVLPLLHGLWNMGCVDFRKHLEFRKDFILQVGSKLSGFAVVVPLAFLTRSYWALVAGAIAGRVGGLALSYALHPFRPRFSLRGTRELFGFSAWMMLNNAVNYLRLRGAHLVIGRLMSSQSLGLYTVSFEMANLPTSELAMPINRAIFPGYSKLQDDRVAMQRAFLRVLGLVALGTVPAGIGMASVAHLFVPAVLGSKWIEAVPLISLLAIGGTIYVLQVNIQSLYYATGRPKLKGLMTLLEIAVLLPLLLLLVPRYELTGAAIAMLATVSLSVPVNFGIALKLLKLSPHSAVKVVWRPAVAASAMYLAIRAMFPPSAAAESSLANLWLLLAAALLGAAAYAATVAALWLFSGRPAGAEAWVWSQLQRLGRPGRSPL